MTSTSLLSNLNQIATFVRQDPGLAANTAAADIEAGAQAAEAINAIIADAITTLNLNGDGRIDGADVEAISAYIRNDATIKAAFDVAHGDDDGNTETGFHLVQNDGAAYRFQGKNFVDTVADGLYHIGFEIKDGRFLNEDGAKNAEVLDVAGWLNYFANGLNVLYGTDGNDRIRRKDYSFALAAAANELFEMGAGNDVAITGAGNDTALGGTGNDKLIGQDGDDSLLGEDGKDTLVGGTGEDVLIGGDDNDRLRGGDDNDTLDGGDGDDRAFGEDGDDDISGGDGNDVLGGGDGNDTLEGGDGNDILRGGNDADTLTGGEGNDKLRGGEGDDLAEGGDGNDIVAGHDGNDTLTGGEGADRLMGGNGDDDVSGGTEDDKLFGHHGNDTLSGDEGKDTIGGGDGNDEMDGGTENDLMRGGSGEDTVTGGDGDDRLFGNNDNDTLTGGDGDDFLSGGNDNDLLDGGADNDTIGGGNGNDILFGDAGEDLLRGGRDDDLMAGGADADILIGGSGADTFDGGAGADVLRVRDREDDADLIIFEQGDSGTAAGEVDTVIGFQSGEDKIDLTDFGPLTFIGGGAFTGGAAVRFADRRLEIDIDGDGTADFAADFKGTKMLMRMDLIIDNQINARFGNDVLVGTDADESIVSRADWGEPEIAQDPSLPRYFEDHPLEEAHDVLTGGGGADAFVFQFDINATEEIVRKHTKSNGMINWHKVAGENGNEHDHWVDGIGNDTITDLDLLEGDTIQLIGHTVAIGDVSYIDEDGDGVDDHTLITVISDQGGNGGAHDQDVLGTITVQNALLAEDDIIVNAAPHFGVTETLDQWLDMFA